MHTFRLHQNIIDGYHRFLSFIYFETDTRCFWLFSSRRRKRRRKDNKSKLLSHSINFKSISFTATHNKWQKVYNPSIKYLLPEFRLFFFSPPRSKHYMHNHVYKTHKERKLSPTKKFVSCWRCSENFGKLYAMPHTWNITSIVTIPLFIEQKVKENTLFGLVGVVWRYENNYVSM